MENKNVLTRSRAQDLLIPSVWIAVEDREDEREGNWKWLDQQTNAKLISLYLHLQHANVIRITAKKKKKDS